MRLGLGLGLGYGPWHYFSQNPISFRREEKGTVFHKMRLGLGLGLQYFFQTPSPVPQISIFYFFDSGNAGGVQCEEGDVRCFCAHLEAPNQKWSNQKQLNWKQLDL